MPPSGARGFVPAARACTRASKWPAPDRPARSGTANWRPRTVLLGAAHCHSRRMPVSPAPTNSFMDPADPVTPDTADSEDAQSRWAPAVVQTHSRSMKLFGGFGRRRRRVPCAAHTLPKKIPNNSQWSDDCVDQTVSKPGGAVCTEECLPQALAPGLPARTGYTWGPYTGTWKGQNQNCVEKSCVTAPGELGSPAPFASCTNLTGTVRPLGRSATRLATRATSPPASPTHRHIHVPRGPVGRRRHRVQPRRHVFGLPAGRQSCVGEGVLG